MTINPSVPAKSGIKFLLLNPAASHFGDLVSQCRAIIVAGGTMQPVDEFKHQLFVAAGAQPGTFGTHPTTLLYSEVILKCSNTLKVPNLKMFLSMTLKRAGGGEECKNIKMCFVIYIDYSKNKLMVF